MQDSFNNVGSPAASKRQLYYAIKFFIRFVKDKAEEQDLEFFLANGSTIVSQNYERVLSNLETLGAGLKEGEAAQRRQKNELNWQEE